MIQYLFLNKAGVYRDDGGITKTNKIRDTGHDFRYLFLIFLYSVLSAYTILGTYEL